ncbi:zinc-ribbon domain-containing protein [Neptunomonas sp.]|uniref:zinc-ribbon domain-containing protein n=1 Tax=Neptunomonas sp. TaxID=1971898 RepID=UPI0035622858
MFCTNCGKETQQDAKFCYQCGHKFSPPEWHPEEETAIVEEQSVPTKPIPSKNNVVVKPEHPKTILPDPIPVDEPTKKGNYFSRHWRGDYSLAVSYWLNYFLIGGILTFAMTGLHMSEYWERLDALTNAYSMLLLYTLLIPITLWQVIGTFRSASKHVRRGGKPFWATTVHILMILGLLRLAAEMATTGGPVIKESFKRITSGIDVQAYELRVMRQGKELELAGGMPSGTAAAVQNILDATPTIKIIHLNNSGGLIEEGYALARLISNRKLITFTSDLCASSCTLAFLSGKERYLSSNGSLGFHSASFGSLDGSKISDLNSEFRSLFKQYGVSKWFIDKALSIPSNELWKPTQAELLDANIVDKVVDPNDFALSGFADWRDQKKIDDILTSTPALKSVSEYDPSFYQSISDLVFEGMQAGKSLNELKLEVRSHLLPRVINRYLPVAPNEELAAYWSTQIAEMKYLEKQSPKYCVEFAYQDIYPTLLDYSSIVPKHLTDSGLQALAEVIEGAALRPVRNESTTQAEKDLAEAALLLMIKDEEYIQAISNPEKYTNKPDILCQSIVALYEQILALPPHRAGPVLRYMMEEE